MDSPASQLSRRLAREAEAVCWHYLSNGRRQGHYWIVGDVHGAPGRSLYVRLSGERAGKFTDSATGEQGDLLDLIALNLGLASLHDTLDEARCFLSLPNPDPPRSDVRNPVLSGSPDAARRLWAMGKPIVGTLAERYLRARRLTGLAHIDALQFHPGCYYWREGNPKAGPPETWPALLAKVTDSAGCFTGLHRTWLDPCTAGKAPLDPNRKAMGNLLGHGVRIGRPGDIMAVGEGLETMLSLRMALPDLPVAAALSANHLAAFIPPDDLTRLYIAVDADAAGYKAANTLKERIRTSGIRAVHLYPARGDFNEDLVKSGPGGMRARLRPQLSPTDAARLCPAPDG